MKDREDMEHQDEMEVEEGDALRDEGGVERQNHAEKIEDTIQEEEKIVSEDIVSETEEKESIDSLKREIEDLKERYLRMYAEFENYKRMVAKEKEELLRYSNESLINAIIPSIDNLEMALRHAEEGVNDGLVKGIELTLKEILRVLEKEGLTQIDALNKPFDPQYHEAMSMVERNDVEPMTVVEEFRKGYMYKDKVLRPSLVAVSRRLENTEDQMNI